MCRLWYVARLNLWAREFEWATQLLDQSGLDQTVLDDIKPSQPITTTPATIAPSQQPQSSGWSY
jgi:hypothetical protein